MEPPPPSSNSSSSSASHKRSKSGLARSILQRVSSSSNIHSNAPETIPEATPPPTSSPSTTSLASSVQQQAGSSSGSTHHRHPSSSKHRPHLSTTMTNTQPSGGHELSATPSSPRAASAADASSASPTTGSSIEQSVKLFKIFEALRSGDTTAIAKSIRDQKEHMPPAGSSSSNSNSSAKESTTSLSLSASSSAAAANAKLEGTSVLHLAIQCATPEVIEFVLSSSEASDVNAKDRDGNTPLHIAAQLGRAPIVRMLLEKEGINDGITNYHGQTALDLARTPEIFQQLQLARSIFVETHVKRMQTLIATRDFGTLKNVLQDTRVKASIDVNGNELPTDPTTVEQGGTLLHEAARRKDLELIQLLLLNGADPFKRDRKGKLPQDVTKDDRTRAILKKSPAAAAAQRGIQEKTILGASTSSLATGGPSGAVDSKDGREMKGYLKKWTNYTSGYKLRWFVLEDGVLSYYKHQDDAGSACRGAINMRIATLSMDPADKLRFEILGKSSVKYHLKANHQVEAKRWYWALNNAIQWSKDEAREEDRRTRAESAALAQAKHDVLDKRHSHRDSDAGSVGASSKPAKLVPSTALGVPNTSGAPSTLDEAPDSTYDSSIAGQDMARVVSQLGTATIEGDIDDEEEFGDDASSHEAHLPAGKDAFNITAQSAKLQLDLLASVSNALNAERQKHPDLKLADPTAVQALASYEAAVANLKGLVGDLLKISRDRDAYWQYRLEREANVRRLWEESMAKVARDQEVLESRFGQSEQKRKMTKRALRDALAEIETSSRPPTPDVRGGSLVLPGSAKTEMPIGRPRAGSLVASVKRRGTVADIELSDDESDEHEEFFDAVDAGEVEVVEMALTSPSLLSETKAGPEGIIVEEDAQLASSFKGYEDGIRKKLKMDADDRPKISLWGILKSMIGKDMTKMTLPVSFNEPTSLLQRVAEDMEYTDLLDIAAERTDSTERMVYVAAFAASEYASTIGRVAKPFNPLLGETYEYARPDKGFRFFIEQVSHHPPIGAAWAESRRWDYYGESAVKSKFYGKSFDINPLGTWFLRLRPTGQPGYSELYTWKKVTSSVIGIITGNPTVDNYGPMEIKNWTTGETCLLDFKPRGWKVSSAYQVAGKVCDAQGKTAWSMGGRWNDKIYARLTPGYEDSAFDKEQGAAAAGKRTDSIGSNQAFLVWQCHERPTGVPFNLTPFVLTLNDPAPKLLPYLAPTDTRLRPDQRAMEDGAYDLAATEKNRVEEKQRAARREREAVGEHFEPRWFKKGRCETTGEEYWVFNHEYWNVRDKVGKGETKWENEHLEDIF